MKIFLLTMMGVIAAAFIVVSVRDVQNVFEFSTRPVTVEKRRDCQQTEKDGGYVWKCSPSFTRH